MVSRSDCPDSTMRKVCGERFCTSSSNCAPSIPGIRMSVTMMSKVCRSIAARASVPPGAKTISHSERMRRKLRCSPLNTMGSSSTNKIRLAMIMFPPIAAASECRMWFLSPPQSRTISFPRAA